jgi:hypothetical protein
MLLNNDSLILAGLVVTSIYVGGIFTYSIYTMFTTTINNESLINTLSNVSENTTPIPVPGPTPLSVLESSNIHKVDVGVQTDFTSV